MDLYVIKVSGVNPSPSDSLPLYERLSSHWSDRSVFGQLTLFLTNQVSENWDYVQRKYSHFFGNYTEPNP